MRAYRTAIPLPTAVRPPRQARPDVRLTILISFAAGILIGVPLTFGALFLTITLDNSFAVDENQHRPTLSEAHGNSSSLPEHPVAATRLTNVPRSGLRTSLTIMPSGSSARPRGKISSKAAAIPLRSIDTGASMTARPSPEKNFVDGIFWTGHAESLVPRGFGDEDVRQWRRFLNGSDVLRVEEGCGRMQNRLVTLSDGRMSCCRYRHNNDQIQGEIFSFYLGRLLHIDNLSPSALALVDPRTGRWSAGAQQMAALAGWNPERPAVLTRFVEHLQPAFVPRQFRDSKKRKLHPEDLGNNLTAPEVSELVQWSDLILFDYLTANLDRVVNNMYNERWNPGMMSQPAHNLAKTPNGLLLFLDNESGLLHGYRLLEKYEHFHRALLDVLCLFRKRTVRALQRLHREDNVDLLLKDMFANGDPGMSDFLPFLPDRSVRTLKERIAQILRQVHKCRSRFEPAPHTKLKLNNR